MPRERIPIACTLSATDAGRQLGEWTDLGPHTISTEPVEGGVALTFPADLADRVEDLAAREAECCAFLQITTTRTADTIRVAIVSEDPAALPVIELLTGSST